MGITTIDARVFNPGDITKKRELTFTVDSGAGYSLVPENVLQELGIEPHTTKSFFLANGDKIQRKMVSPLSNILRKSPLLPSSLAKKEMQR